MYRLTDQEFKSALREAVIQNASRPDGPYKGKLPKDFKPFHPLWHSEDGTINRAETLAESYYHFLTDEQRKKLLEEV